MIVALEPTARLTNGQISYKTSSGSDACLRGSYLPETQTKSLAGRPVDWVPVRSARKDLVPPNNGFREPHGVISVITNNLEVESVSKRIQNEFRRAERGGRPSGTLTDVRRH